MATVHFTANLQRHIEAASMPASGATVGEVLASIFAQRPELRPFIVDEQGALRAHMVVFIDGRTLTDRAGLSDAVPRDASVHVMQALSGG